MEPKDAQSEPTGAKRSPKGSPREPKGSPKGAKGTQKGAKGEPKDDQNALKNRPSDKVAKMMKKGGVHGYDLEPFWEPKSIKNPCKNRSFSRPWPKVDFLMHFGRPLAPL